MHLAAISRGPAALSVLGFYAVDFLLIAFAISAGPRRFDTLRA
jgi:hypothetical protein